MIHKLFALAFILSTSMWSVAHASVVTFNLGGGGNGTVYDSANPLNGYTVTQGNQSVTIYGATVSNNPNSNYPNDGGPGAFTSAIPIFSVTDNHGGNIASGMAPYVPSEGGYTSQLGITESNVLVLDLSQLTAGSTVQFLMTQGTTNDSYNVWTGTANTTTDIPTGLGTSTSFSTGANPLATEAYTGRQVSTSPTFTITAGPNEWIAIQADCHYLLLDTITVTTPSGVPEPSFYGLLAVGLFGLVVVARQRRLRTLAPAVSGPAVNEPRP